ncbi:hypothetical protein ATK30_8784 [Amycolatopsis echigonensis]|uniref:Uncharacterized protein n=1 Tax=Amycolatopsis echigonensis TaxID=2576905 RepID=A0A2N3WVB3_9PSEU|nr:hypothetical protein ATK30_8784 [Amycolatopsis niigatensis]
MERSSPSEPATHVSPTRHHHHSRTAPATDPAALEHSAFPATDRNRHRTEPSSRGERQPEIIDQASAGAHHPISHLRFAHTRSLPRQNRTCRRTEPNSHVSQPPTHHPHSITTTTAPQRPPTRLLWNRPHFPPPTGIGTERNRVHAVNASPRSSTTSQQAHITNQQRVRGHVLGSEVSAGAHHEPPVPTTTAHSAARPSLLHRSVPLLDTRAFPQARGGAPGVRDVFRDQPVHLPDGHLLPTRRLRTAAPPPADQARPRTNRRSHPPARNRPALPTRSVTRREP